MTNLSSQAFGLDRKIQSPNSSLSDIYDLRIGEPKISQFPFDVLDELYEQKNINCYYPSHGDFALREMILNKYYNGFNVDNIAITHGTMGALDFIFRANLNRDSEILIPDPGFPPYSKLAEFSNGIVKKYALNLSSNADTFVNWDNLESLITRKTKILLLNSPHNPSGKILTKSDVFRFVEILSKYPNLTFVMDEVYRELIYDNKVHYDFSSFIGRGYVVGSFSKMFPLQGARVGWVLGSEENMKKLTPYFNNATGAMSSFGQEIVKSILKRKMSFHKNYASALILAKDILDSYEVDYVDPEGAFFFFVKYNLFDSQVVDELNELGVGVVPGSVFGDRGGNFIRASFAQEDSVLKNAFSIIGDHWRQSQKRSRQ